jgi:hypothetical protein
MLDSTLAAVQLVCLMLVFIGVLLLSTRVRRGLVAAYTSATLDHIAGGAEQRSLRVARSACRFLYINRLNRPSLLKTLVIAAVGAAFIGVPVTAIVYTSTWGATEGAGDLLDRIFQALPSFMATSLLVHWVAEYFLAFVLWHSLTRKPRLSFLAVFVRVLAAVAAVFVAIAAGIVGLVKLDGTASGVSYFGLALLLTGPGILLTHAALQLPLSNFVFFVALIPCITMASVVLLLAFAHAATRFAPLRTLLGALVQRIGPSSGPALVVFGATAFGLLTDFFSSKPMLARLLGL